MLNDSLKQHRDDASLSDDELASVTGGLLGAYADTTIGYTGDCETVLIQEEELANAKGNSGCGKP